MSDVSLCLAVINQIAARALASLAFGAIVIGGVWLLVKTVKDFRREVLDK